MNQERALELLEELNGDEHEWVDYKEDYYIKGRLIWKASSSGIFKP
jgi:hypothetical protein